MENEYQLRLKDMNYNEKMKELTEKFIQEMESLKTKNQVHAISHTCVNVEFRPVAEHSLDTQHSLMSPTKSVERYM